ncbi:MAG: hypothetical protein H6626_12470 [Pseudobdellovibrionaceae bacterium]|nr:hypothetical protein [Bdellovibrionales bacterium]USN46996.1 MAG: hypothetical protein H6626_12470 [Pseudobdellovibrionaceae bacterium]
MSNKSPLRHILYVKLRLRSKTMLSLGALGVSALLFGLSTKGGFPQFSFTKNVSGKDKILQSSHLGTSHTSKLHAPLSLSIEKMDQTADAIHLSGTVLPHQDLQNVQVRWVLPKGATLTAGDSKVDLKNLKSGLAEKLEITVVSHEDENFQIHLKATANIGKITMGQSAQFNTRDQEEINQQKAELFEKSK